MRNLVVKCLYDNSYLYTDVSLPTFFLITKDTSEAWLRCSMSHVSRVSTNKLLDTAMHLNVLLITDMFAHLPHYLPTWAACLQLWPHCFSVLCASSSSCLSLEVSAPGPEGSRVGGVPGEPWADGKCSQMFVLIPFRPTKKNSVLSKSFHPSLHNSMSSTKVHKPKELWDGPRKVPLSDWPGCDRWVEKNGDTCDLIGGDGEGELKGAELLKDPGMLTGAELWSWLPPLKTDINMICTCMLLHDVNWMKCTRVFKFVSSYRA